MTPTRRYTDPDDWDGIFQRNQAMGAAANRLGRELLEKTLAEWATRIKAGEVPPAPSASNRYGTQLRCAQWDWGAPNPLFTM